MRRIGVCSGTEAKSSTITIHAFFHENLHDA